MLKVLINGCKGKMGQEVARRIKETEEIENEEERKKVFQIVDRMINEVD